MHCFIQVDTVDAYSLMMTVDEYPREVPDQVKQLRTGLNASDNLILVAFN